MSQWTKERIATLEAEIKRLQAAVESLGAQVCQFHDSNPLDAEVVRLEKESEERRQWAWRWRDAATRIFRLWNPTGPEYDHWVKHIPELGHDHWHLCICSKQWGPVKECSVCQGRSEYDLVSKSENTVEALEAENRVVRELVEDALDHLWVRDREYYQRILDRCTWMMGEEYQKPIDAERVLERLGIRIGVTKVTTGVWEVQVGGHRVGLASFESTAVEDAKILSETLARSVRQAVDPLLARIAALTREYQDYMTIADHCTAVYSHFSGGRISKPFTLPAEVIAQAEAIQQEDFETWRQENNQQCLEIALDAIKARLQEFVAKWESGNTRDDCYYTTEDLVTWIEETFKETP